MAQRVLTSKRYDLTLMSRTTFPGTIIPYTGAVTVNSTEQEVLSGYLLCNGAAVSRTTYAGLFSEIGTTYGAGNGSTTFNLPDLLGRLPASAGSGVRGTLVRGANGGGETATLTTAQLPAHGHSHSLTLPNHTHGPGTLAVASHSHGGGNHNHSGSSGFHDHTVWEPYHAFTIGYYSLEVTAYADIYYRTASNTGGNAGGLSINSSGTIVNAESPAVNAGATANPSSNPAVSGTIADTGSGNGHDNMPPYLVVGGYLIKY